ncbi:MAG: hypothetical protein ABUS51_05170 [Acidobacteriota bacterium]
MYNIWYDTNRDASRIERVHARRVDAFHECRGGLHRDRARLERGGGLWPEVAVVRWEAFMRRWTLDHLVWDTSGGPDAGFPKWLWATRKLWLAVAGSAFLTWREWVKHHPPEIAIVELIHFVFVLAAIALFVRFGTVFRRKDPKP